MLREAIESILGQTYKNLELILIDDCSTENNVFSFIDEYNDPRIKLFHNEENKGCTYSLNRGISLSSGEFIARMDADDISLPKRIELQVEYMMKHPEVKVLGSRAYIFGSFHKAIALIPDKWEYIRPALLFNNVVAHPSVMVRRSLFDIDGLTYDESFRNSQDYDLWNRVAETGDYIHEYPRLLLLYRMHERQVSSPGNNRVQAECAMRVRRRYLTRYFDASENELMCQEALTLGTLIDGVTLDDVKAWIFRMLDVNKKDKIYCHRYLRLILLNRFIRVCGSGAIAHLGTVIRIGGFEIFECAAIGIHKTLLGLVYSSYGK